MTTAARPTYDPARGGTGKGEGDLSKLSKQYSSRDLPGHTKLKYRQPGQSSQPEVRARDPRRELEERERAAARERRGDRSRPAAQDRQPAVASKRPRVEAPPANLDADDPVDQDSDSDSDSDDEDDTAALLEELSKIKRERAVEKQKQEEEKKERDERIRTENILQGNPLLIHQANFKVKRRWDDDVIFKNCANDDKKRGHDKDFINDMVRSEFHKKFLERYVK